jgi:hypothetical protein
MESPDPNHENGLAPPSLAASNPTLFYSYPTRPPPRIIRQIVGSEFDETGRVRSPIKSRLRKMNLSRLNGGGGDRTRVPRRLREGLYVRSRYFGFNRGCPLAAGCSRSEPGTWFSRGRAQQ